MWRVNTLGQHSVRTLAHTQSPIEQLRLEPDAQVLGARLELVLDRVRAPAVKGAPGRV